MKSIDLNCDLGEGGALDAVLMPLVSSANIACGGHAGDRATMEAAVALAERHGVALGAHPGFRDRANFGRVELPLATGELAQLLAEQISALQSLAPVRHVKLHGALYNLAARDPRVAVEVAATLRDLDASWLVYALAGSELVRAARTRGLRVVEEVFADRTYRADGLLTPRTEPGAVRHDEQDMLEHVLRMVEHGVVRATDGSERAIAAETLCIHGDTPDAVTFARRLRAEFASRGIAVRPPAVVG